MAEASPMPYSRFRRVVQGQGGFTLIELLVAMPIAILLLGVVIEALGQASRDQQDIEYRTESLNNAEVGLERMTREIRQATWLFFWSSSVVDINVRVRASATAEGEYRLVRYDCSTDACVRSEGPAMVYPPPANPAFTTAAVLIGTPEGDTFGRDGRILGHDVFRPMHIDSATGARTADFLKPDYLSVRLRLAVPRHEGALELSDGVNLRNLTQFKAP